LVAGDRTHAAGHIEDTFMVSKIGWRLIWVVLGVAALVAVAVVAYQVGASGGYSGPFFMRRGSGMLGWEGGVGWWGIVPALMLVFLVIVLFVILLGGFDRPSRPTTPGPAAPTQDVDRLRELVELHDRGQLNDEEFAAAKRKILGL
jgi:uncharacterized membrane protein